MTVTPGSPATAGSVAAALAAWPGAGAGLAPGGCTWALASMEPGEAKDSFSMGLGVVLWVAVSASLTTALTTLGCLVTAAGASASGVCQMAIADRQGSLIATTASMSSVFAAAGFAEGTLSSPVPVVAGTVYYLGLVTHFSTEPGVAGRTGPVVPVIPGGQGIVPAVGLASQASLVSFTPGTGNATSASLFAYGR